MTHAPSDPWLELIHALRAQTGIKPIPLSAAERQCGMVAAFAAAVAPHPSEPVTSLPYRPEVPPEPKRGPGPGEMRRAVLAHIRQAVEQIRTTESTAGRSATAPPTPVPTEEGASLPPKRTAMHLAAYRKTSR